MQDTPTKGIEINFKVIIPSIDPKELHYDPDPESNDQRKVLGRGGFGVVYAGHYHGEPVAIKALHVTTPKLVADLHKEAGLMFSIKSPCIVALRGIASTQKETTLVMEMMSGGSLFHLLQNDAIVLSWPDRYRLAYEIAEGLWALHQREIVHRDMKSLNVMLDANQHAKLTDFGFSKLRGQITSMAASSKHSLGTPAYRAPEIVALDMGGKKASGGAKIDPYSPYSDIYAYGVILWELATRQIPFAEENPFAVMMTIAQGNHEEIPANCPPEFAALIEACWAMRPADRPRTDEIVRRTKALYDAELARQTPVEDAVDEKAESVLPAPWHMDEAVKMKAGVVKTYVRLPPAESDLQKVVAAYAPAPVPGYGIKRVEVIYNPRLNRAFGLDLDLLEQRFGKSAFDPAWRDEGGQSGQWREQTHRVLERMAAPYRDPARPHVTLLPMWHATKQEILDSLFETGFAALATVDPGFFGKGIYSAGEAAYSWGVYGKMYDHPALLLNWVASYSAYPVIDGDMARLQAKGHHANHDAHFVPVVPQNPKNPNETNFIPCKPGQKYKYTELVVFEKAQCLARYVVELQSDLLPTPSIVQQAALQHQAEQQAKANAQQQLDAAQQAALAQQQAETAAKAQKIAADKEAAVKQAAEQGGKQGAMEAKVIADQQAEQMSKQMQQQMQQHLQKMEQLEKAAAQQATEQAEKLKAAQAETEQAKKAPLKYIPGPGMYNPPKAGPAPVMAADIMEEKISEQEKQRFFRHIARGEQDEAEAMLKKTPSLAFAKGKFDDISDLRCLQPGDQFQRIFQDISGWQYAIWAGDIHMCQMMKRCFTQVPNAKPLIQTAKSQYLEVLGGRGDFAPNQHGRQFDLTPLIDALKLYVKQYDSWTLQQLTHQWCKVIGGLQRKLPAHVINEYCRPDRSFEVNGGPPDFLDATLPRKAYMSGNQEYGLDWLLETIYSNGKMGDSWAASRACMAEAPVALMEKERLHYPGQSTYTDAKALDSLKARRSQQIEQLSGELDASMGVGLSPSPFKQ